MATTIVHAADVHLETVFPDVRGGGARRAALADAFERIVDLALERNADVLTIGGDLYESERAGPATARFLFAAFARFGKPVFVAPGQPRSVRRALALCARRSAAERARFRRCIVDRRAARSRA